VWAQKALATDEQEAFRMERTMLLHLPISEGLFSHHSPVLDREEEGELVCSIVYR
jgi:hypothetical protein